MKLGVCKPGKNVMAFLLLGATFFVAVGAIDVAAREHADQTKRVERITCQQVNGVKKTITDIINRSAGPTPIPPGADQALHDVIIQSNLRAAADREKDLHDLLPTDCKGLVDNPPPTTTTTVDPGAPA